MSPQALQGITSGDPGAQEQLLAPVYGELRALAASKMARQPEPALRRPR